jgi:hypothetical protein
MWGKGFSRAEGIAGRDARATLKEACAHRAKGEAGILASHSDLL